MFTGIEVPLEVAIAREMTVSDCRTSAAKPGFTPGAGRKTKISVEQYPEKGAPTHLRRYGRSFPKSTSPLRNTLFTLVETLE